MFCLSEEYKQIRERFKEDYDRLLMLVQKIGRGSYVEDDLEETAYALNTFDKSFDTLKKMPEDILSENEKDDRGKVIVKVTKSYEAALRVIESFDSKREGKRISDYRKEISKNGQNGETGINDIELFRSDFNEWMMQKKQKVAELDAYIGQLEGEISEIDKGIAEREVKIEENRALIRELSANIEKMQPP